MAEATWEVSVDLTSDGDFSDANEDISSDVISAAWTVGFTQAYQYVARPSRASIVLRNDDGKYSPEHGSAISGWASGIPLRIRSVFAATTRQYGIWWIKDVQPTADSKGSRTVRVEAEGFMARAQKIPVKVGLQTNSTADQLVTELLSATTLYPPGASGRWFLNVAGQGELGEATMLGQTSDYTDFDTGIESFPYAFDNSSRAASLYSQVRTIAESEQGKVFVDRDGKLVLWSRHHLSLITSSAETFNDSMAQLRYAHGGGVVNICSVQFHPRELDTTGTPTLFTLQKAFSVSNGDSRDVTWRFSEADSDSKISTTSGITPVATTDYTANTEEDGTGTDVTSDVSVTAVFDAQSVDLTFSNSGSEDAYIQVGSKVRGNDKLRDFGRMEVEHQDDSSIASYGRQSTRVSARLLDEQNTAESLARYVVLTRKDARGEVASVSFKPRHDDTLMTAALARTMGDRITIAETQTGVSADYFIIGERHELRRKDYQLTWFLEPASGQEFWILGLVGFGELNTNTVLGY